VGDYVEEGSVIGELLTDKLDQVDPALKKVLNAITLSKSPVEAKKLIFAKVTHDSVDIY